MSILLVLAVAACGAAREPVTTLPDGAVQSHRGVWIGKSHHDTIGMVSVHRAGGSALILIEDNFYMSNVRGAVVALGRDGFERKAVVSELLRSRGRQVYRVPDGIRMTDFNEVWLWDSARDRPLGLARLRGI
jgi:hypothetical protein